MHLLDLLPLSPNHIEPALEKAEHYRALNEPGEAESICKDVLAVDATNARALRILGLALTDQFPNFRAGLFEEAMRVFVQLKDDYDRVYHEGLAWERLAKAQLARNEGHGALTSIEHALEHFEKAAELCPKNVPDPILRWNRCVRLIQANHLLREAMESPRHSAHLLGD